MLVDDHRIAAALELGGLLEDDVERLRERAFCSVVTTIGDVPFASASASCRDPSSIFSTTPLVDSNCATSSRSCRSRTMRSVTTIT